MLGVKAIQADRVATARARRGGGSHQRACEQSVEHHRAAAGDSVRAEAATGPDHMPHARRHQRAIEGADGTRIGERAHLPCRWRQRRRRVRHGRAEALWQHASRSLTAWSAGWGLAVGSSPPRPMPNALPQAQGATSQKKGTKARNGHKAMDTEACAPVSVMPTNAYWYGATTAQ